MKRKKFFLDISRCFSRPTIINASVCVCFKNVLMHFWGRPDVRLQILELLWNTVHRRIDLPESTHRRSPVQLRQLQPARETITLLSAPINETQTL